MARYGIGYQGSKNGIADQIIAHLPAGRRLVDLFGGGFAISHCALLSGKWQQILYNDINPLLPKLISDAIHGKYNRNTFVPEWIDRETFHRLKDTDGYIKYVWSFSCNGIDYLFGKNVEEEKHAMHEWVIHGTPIPGHDDLSCDLPCEPAYYDKRLSALRRYTKNSGRYQKKIELQNLEQIGRLQNLERLEGLQLMSKDYREYEYQEGDVVYCDIPYPNCKDMNPNKNYKTEFDHGAFYQWAISRPYPVYFSSYKLGGIVWEGDKSVTNGGQGNSLFRREVLYCVDNDFETPKKYLQGRLFE
jgi:hypothetical protein